MDMFENGLSIASFPYSIALQASIMKSFPRCAASVNHRRICSHSATQRQHLLARGAGCCRQHAVAMVPAATRPVRGQTPFCTRTQLRYCSTRGAGRNGPDGTQSVLAADAFVGDTDGSRPSELRFYEDFDLTEDDIHHMLLCEASAKHGVLMNVPPQLPPSGTPPEVPEVILPAVQVERLHGMKLAYEPTHLPPPLHTTGTRQLIVDDSFHTVLATRKTVTESSNDAVQREAAVTAVKDGADVATADLQPSRLPPDPTMKFHCNACGKAFRLKSSAEHHVKLNHPTNHKAAVADGPGKGELVGEGAASVAPAAAKAAITSSVATTCVVSQTTTAGLKDNKKHLDQQKEPTTSGVGAVKMLHDRATLSLPEEELVDELLVDVWDVVAAQREDVPKSNSPNNFIPFSSAVTGTADRRKEMEANARPSPRATPEGAAPGIKRLGAMTGGAMPVGRSRGVGAVVPIRELVKKYPNPFGDSPNAALMELENEPINPFIPQEELAAQLSVAREKDSEIAPAVVTSVGTDGATSEELKKKLRATRPSLAVSASSRRFVCPICGERQGDAQRGEVNGGSLVPSFRVLDALLDHVESEHGGEELTEEQLRVLYATERQSTLYPPRSSGTVSGKTGQAPDDPSKKANDNHDERNSDNVAGLNSLPEELKRAMPPAPVEEEALAVHIRAGSNAVLLGRVADVQHGFLGPMNVTQYVVEVDGDDAESTIEPSTPEAPPNTPSSPVASSDGGVRTRGPVEREKEFIVVRCMGDNFPTSLLKEQVKLGSKVLVQGTLRMNRHIDNVSKRLHAYPFVKVVPPLGYIKVLG
uniref:WGS project CAEQ00000000 data, annotated contig 2447 n=1 Tax=Trypanosoma congolense (strain IL3000) TaxID=1068625 RepID=F9WE86_TRYCI|nr:unnamed protein product [Trypanosoma congolense IL3000]